MSDDERAEYRFAARFTLQQSWALAAEIVADHPELTISRIQRADDNQLLMVHDGATGPRIQFDHFAGAEYLDAERRKHTLAWLALFAQDDPLVSVRSLEQAAGLDVPHERPEVTGRVLVYRLISRALGLNLDDEHSWQAVAVPLLAPEEVVKKSRDVLERWFPTAQTAASGYLDDLRAAANAGEQYWHEPLWFLLSDATAVAVLDEAGYAHLPRGRLNLMKIYEATEGDLAGMAALVLHEPTDLFALDVVMGTQQ